MAVTTNPAVTGVPVQQSAQVISGGTIDNTPIGGSVPAPGNFTTGSFSGTLTPAQVAGIVGTTANNDAQAGSVGEVISSVITATGVALISATPKTVTSISLTAGDWDLFGTVNFSSTVTTSFTIFKAGYSTTTDVLPGAQTQIDQTVAPTVPGGASIVFALPTQRVSLAITTTYFLVAQATFSVSTAGAYCNFFARRRR